MANLGTASKVDNGLERAVGHQGSAKVVVNGVFSFIHIAFIPHDFSEDISVSHW